MSGLPASVRVLNEAYKANKVAGNHQPAPKAARYAEGVYGGKTHVNTLWVGNLPTDEHTNESTLQYMFYEFMNRIKSLRVVQEKDSQPCFDSKEGISETKRCCSGYGFVEFHDRETAEYCYLNLNGKWVPGRHWKYRLNWASFNITDEHERHNRNNEEQALRNGRRSPGKRDSPTNRPGRGKPGTRDSSRSRRTNEQSSDDTTSLWIGSLDAQTTSDDLQTLFATYFKSVRNAHVPVDPNDQQSRCFGFVKFNDPKEAELALCSMNGKLLNGKPIRVNRSFGDRSNRDDHLNPSNTYNLYSATESQAQHLAKFACSVGGCAGGSTIIVSNLNRSIREDIITRHFRHFGKVLECSRESENLPWRITFASSSAAVSAAAAMNTAMIGSSKIAVEIESANGFQTPYNYNGLLGGYNLNCMPYNPYNINGANLNQHVVPTGLEASENTEDCESTWSDFSPRSRLDFACENVEDYAALKEGEELLESELHLEWCEKREGIQYFSDGEASPSDHNSKSEEGKQTAFLPTEPQTDSLTHGGWGHTEALWPRESLELEIRQQRHLIKNSSSYYSNRNAESVENDESTTGDKRKIDVSFLNRCYIRDNPLPIVALNLIDQNLLSHFQPFRRRRRMTASQLQEPYTNKVRISVESTTCSEDSTHSEHPNCLESSSFPQDPKLFWRKTLRAESRCAKYSSLFQV